MHQNNIEYSKLIFLCHGFKECTGGRYIGGYIGDDKSKLEWLKDRTYIWDRKFFTIRKTVGKYTPGKLRRNGMHNPIGVDISTTHHHE